MTEYNDLTLQELLSECVARGILVRKSMQNEEEIILALKRADNRALDKQNRLAAEALKSGADTTMGDMDGRDSAQGRGVKEEGANDVDDGYGQGDAYGEDDGHGEHDGIWEMGGQEAISSTGVPLATIAGSAGPIFNRKDSASIRSALSSHFYITISTEDIPFQSSKLGNLGKFFSAGGKLVLPFIYCTRTEWFATFGDNEKAAVECFERFLLENYKGLKFGMELFGKDGKLLMKSKKQVLRPKNTFDRNWVAFELLQRLNAYTAV